MGQMENGGHKFKTNRDTWIYIQHHPDKGCKRALRCQECPIPDCKWDGSKDKWRHEQSG